MSSGSSSKKYKRGVALKYGGTSVATAKQDKTLLKNTVEVHQNVPQNGYTILVSSGQGKINGVQDKKATDYMYDIINGKNSGEAWRIFTESQNKKLHDHQMDKKTARQILQPLFEPVQEIIDSTNIDAKAQALIAGLPERTQMAILNAVGSSLYKDVQFMLLNHDFGLMGERTDPQTYIDVAIDHDASLERIQVIAKRMDLKGKIALVPGFLGNILDCHKNNLPIDQVTMERGSSDATATYWGAALDLDEIIIYSDRAGILPVDPEIVPGLVPLTDLSYREASAFAGLGARIIQDVAIRPAEERRIKIQIRDSKNRSFKGTKIGICGVSLEHYGVKAIACAEDYAAIKVGRMRNNQKGVAAQVGREFANHGFNIADQYDSSSSHLYVVRSNPNLHNLVERLGKQHPIELEYPVARIALVGDGISLHQKLQKIIYAKSIFTDVLENNAIPVKAYSRVEDSVVISAVIPQEYKSLALKKLAVGFGFKKH